MKRIAFYVTVILLVFSYFYIPLFIQGTQSSYDQNIITIINGSNFSGQNNSSSLFHPIKYFKPNADPPPTPVVNIQQSENQHWFMLFDTWVWLLDKNPELASYRSDLVFWIPPSSGGNTTFDDDAGNAASSISIDVPDFEIVKPP